jgi:VIT1/CCC1 family predicted Fe2+/Mn2+ transporter
MNNTYTKSPVEILTDLKMELLDFVNTRVAMLQSEMKEKIRTLKLATPALIVGLVLVTTAWFLLTGCLVAVVAMAFAPNPWAYPISFIIVGLTYLIFGGIAAIAAWKRMMGSGLAPWRTIHVLQQDKVWIAAEGKAQL